MHYDAIIIGAGMSGLAAGIRLAMFDKRVCILERHYAYGGLNSYYKIDGREFDVGLHAVTNFAPPGDRSAPLAKLLRQLRLTREDFDLKPQVRSEIRFPGRTLRFSNDIDLLIAEVSATFPGERDGFLRLIDECRAFDFTRLDLTPRPSRPVLRSYLRDPALIDMILCPVMYYGSAEEHDLDFTQFVIMFRSLFLEGFGRPIDGVRRIVRALVRKFRSCGGALRMRTGVRRLVVEGERVGAVELDSGESLTADTILSSAGYVETMRLCADGKDVELNCETGQLSFVESIAVLDRTPSSFGHDATIIFFNDAESFTYARPSEPVDVRSGVVCSPNNYVGHESLAEGVFRVTWLADHAAWSRCDEATYRGMKDRWRDVFLREAERYMPGCRPHVRFVDMFTPRTITRFTGHLNGAVYGSPVKRRDGRTRLSNLFLCGTDQGFLGIVGALLSGITIANLHVLSQPETSTIRP